MMPAYSGGAPVVGALQNVRVYLIYAALAKEAGAVSISAGAGYDSGLTSPAHERPVLKSRRRGGSPPVSHCAAWWAGWPGADPPSLSV